MRWSPGAFFLQKLISILSKYLFDYNLKVYFIN